MTAAGLRSGDDKMNMKSYSPNASGYAARIKNEEWERYREKLTRLHSQNVPRKQMLEILQREDGFTPSLPQLNARFNIWSLRRYDKASSIPSTSIGSSSQGLGHNNHLSHPSFQNTMTLSTTRTRSVVVDGSEQVDAMQSYSSHLEDDLTSFENLSGEESLGSDYLPGILTPKSTTSTGTQVSSSTSDSVPVTPESLAYEPTVGRNALSTFDPSSATARDDNMTEARYTRRVVQSKAARSSNYAILSIPSPTDLLVTDKLLRSVNEFTLLMLDGKQKRQAMIGTVREQVIGEQARREIRRLHIRRGINATAEAYENAHYFLKLGEPANAIKRLYDAGSTVPMLFIEPDLFLLVRVIEIATWSSWKKFPGYEPVVFKFLATKAGEALGPQHPLALLLTCFSESASISGSYPTLWSFLIDHIDRMADDHISRGEAQEIRIKAYFYLVRVLRNNRDYFAAVQRCKELIQLCIAIDGIRSFSANRARYNLAVNYCEVGDMDAALEAYEDARQYLGTADSPYDGWIFAVFAASELAQLHEQIGNNEKAAEFYEEALVGFLQCGGDESSGAMLMLKDLKEFYGRIGDEKELARLQMQYPTCGALLSAGVLDDPRHWIGPRVTTQASGGKNNRAWTWTSPIP